MLTAVLSALRPPDDGRRPGWLLPEASSLTDPAAVLRRLTEGIAFHANSTREGAGEWTASAAELAKLRQGLDQRGAQCFDLLTRLSGAQDLDRRLGLLVHPSGVIW